MSRIAWTRPKIVAVAVVALVIVGVAVGQAVSGGTSSSPTKSPAGSRTASLLSADYARSVGYPKTYRKATTTKVTDAKGCSDTDEVVYEDATGDTALLSDTLNCESSSAAASALASVRKQVQTDDSFDLPAELGPSAFATASNDPEYLVAWHTGSHVAIVALDVNVKATSSKSAPRPLTSSQRQTLIKAAVKQNSLYG
jgi:hypothetical protein